MSITQEPLSVITHQSFGDWHGQSPWLTHRASVTHSITSQWFTHSWAVFGNGMRIEFEGENAAFTLFRLGTEQSSHPLLCQPTYRSFFANFSFPVSVWVIFADSRLSRVSDTEWLRRASWIFCPICIPACFEWLDSVLSGFLVVKIYSVRQLVIVSSHLDPISNKIPSLLLQKWITQPDSAGAAITTKSMKNAWKVLRPVTIVPWLD